MHAYAPPATEVPLAEGVGGRRLELRRVEPISAGKLMGVLYGTLALMIGLLYAAAIVSASAYALTVQGDPSALVGLPLAVVVAGMVPVFYGGMGAIAGAILAAVYNFAAGRVGGLRFELSEA